MLNPSDALGLMEDMSALSAANAGVEDAMRRAGRNQSSAVAIAAIALQQKDQQLASLRRELNKVANARNANRALDKATVSVLASFIKSEALRTGEKESVICSRVNYERSRAYDKKIDEFIRDGYLSEDPRKNPELIALERWYIPEYD